MKKYFLIWLLVWVIIAVLVSIVGYSKILPGIGLAAFISFIFMIKTLNEQWSGEVTAIKKEEVPSSGDTDSTETVEFAYLKLDNSKVKKIRNMGYTVGEKLEKRRGKAMIRTQKN